MKNGACFFLAAFMRRTGQGPKKAVVMVRRVSISISIRDHHHHGHATRQSSKITEGRKQAQAETPARHRNSTARHSTRQTRLTDTDRPRKGKRTSHTSTWVATDSSPPPILQPTRLARFFVFLIVFSNHFFFVFI